MSEPMILSTLDEGRLVDALGRFARNVSAYVRAELAHKIKRAQRCPPTQIPPQIITMNSRALLLTSHWELPREIHLVYPERENCLEDRVSVLSPLGVRLLGSREGAVFRVWDRRRATQVFLLGLTYQPEAEKHWDL